MLADATRRPARYGLDGHRALRRVRGEPARADRPRSVGARARARCAAAATPLPSDVRDLASDVLRHRLVLSYEALERRGHAGRPPRPGARGRRARRRLDRRGPGGSARRDRRSPLSPAPGAQGPGPTPSRIVLKALDLALVRRAAGRAAGRAPLAGRRARAPSSPSCACISPATTCASSTPPRARAPGVPHVRLHVPERLMTAWIVLDVSPSMAFGTGLAPEERRRRRRGDACSPASQCAAADARGLVLCGGRAETILPPAQRTTRVRRDRARHRRRRRPGRRRRRGQPRAGARAGPPPARVGGPRRRRLRLPAEDGWARPLRALGQRHSLVAVEMRDPREESASRASGVLRLVDPESGRQVEADTRDARLRQRYAEREQAAARDRPRRAPRRPAAEHVALDHRRLRGSQQLGTARRGELRLPALLLSLAALPALAAAVRRGCGAARGATACAFPGAPVLAGVVAAVPRWRRHVPAAVAALALAALAVALARPHATVAVPVERASVVLVTDVSRSMLATDVEPSRLDAARGAAESFLDSVPDELRVGARRVLLHPALDRGAESRPRAACARSSRAWTRTAAPPPATGWPRRFGCCDARRSDRRPPAAGDPAAPDGETTSRARPGRRWPVTHAPSGRADPHRRARHERGDDPGRRAAASCRCRRIRRRWREIAEASGGESFDVDEAGELDSIYERLGSQIATRPEEREITAGFAAGGMVLLLAAAALALCERRRTTALKGDPR